MAQRSKKAGKPAENKGRPYRPGELDLILSLPPTEENVARLASAVGRSPDAIRIVYRIAYRENEKFAEGAKSQRERIDEAKTKAGFIL